MASDPAMKSTPDGADPEPVSEIATRHAFSIRRAYQQGTKEYGRLPLGFHSFAGAVVDRVRRRFDRACAGNRDERIGSILSRIAGADLYLAVACENRAEGAWQVFSDRFLPRLRRFMLRKGIPENEADEILADLPGDLFVPPPGSRAASRIGTYDGSGQLFYWLVTIILRRRADRTRARKRTGSLEGENGPEGPEPRQSADETIDPEQIATVQETCRRIMDAVRSAWRELTPRHLLLLRFKFLTRRSQKEMARTLGVSEALVSHLLRDGVEKTRQAVETQVVRESGDAWPDSDRLWSALSDLLGQNSAPAEVEALPRDLPTMESTDHEGT